MAFIEITVRIIMYMVIGTKLMRDLKQTFDTFENIA